MLHLNRFHSTNLFQQAFGQLERYGGEWINPDLNFDTMKESVITLFTVQSTEGWIDVMWDAVDGVGVNQQP